MKLSSFYRHKAKADFTNEIKTKYSTEEASFTKLMAVAVM